MHRHEFFKVDLASSGVFYLVPMQKTDIRFLFVGLIFFLASDLLAQNTCAPKRDFDLLVNVVEKNFYDKSLKGLDWTERAAYYRQQVECGASDESIAVVVNSLLAELKTSHTGLYTPHDLKYWSLKSIFSRGFEKFKVPFSGIWPVKIGDEWFVQYILDESPAAQAGVQVGEKIISLNGKPYQGQILSAKKESDWEVSADGASQRVVKIKQSGLFSMQAHFLKAMQNSKKIIRVDKNTVGYIHLWSGTHDRFLSELDKSLRAFKKQKVDGLIIDLRGGFGGAHPEYLKLLTSDTFLKKLPKVFLIDEGVASGKEWVAAIVKRDKIGKLIGSRTAGAFIAGAPFDDILGNRFFLYLAVQEFKPADIPVIEGVGVSPDVDVPSCNRYCQGRDLQMEAALRYIFI